MATVELSSRYSTLIDTAFSVESRIEQALGSLHKSEFNGVKSVWVQSFNPAPIGNYTRTGTSRYGTPDDISNAKKEYTVARDRAFTFIIDKGNYTQNQMMYNAGAALDTQMKDELIPEFDRYGFWTLAKNAGTSVSTTISDDQNAAYKAFLDGQAALDDANVPESGRLCFCSHTFMNALKVDSGGFIRYGNDAQQMAIKGTMGEVDGVRIVKTSTSLLPTGCQFLLLHPIASAAPKQLWETKIHTDPPGISGWLVEGRFLYDCFVFDKKKNAIYYHGTAPAATFPEKDYSSGGSG